MESNNVERRDSGCNTLCYVRRDRLRGFAGPFQGHARGLSPRAAPCARALFFVALLIGTAAGGQSASARDYGLVAMNFDLWCQEEAHLPADRCDQRTASDEKAFEEFQLALGPYEARNLREAQQEQWLDREFLDNDPIDNPSVRKPVTAVQMPLPRRVDRQ
jgi:hypothetical protein